MYRIILSMAFVGAAVQAAEPSYTKDVQPIFLKRCGGCHLSKVKMGGLNIETFDGLMQGGSTGKSIVPGKSKESRLYLMLTGEITPGMPMNGSHLPLAQVELIRQWIDAGAKGPAAGEKEEEPTSEAAPAKVLKPAPNLKPQIFDIAWSGDGKTLAMAAFKTVRLMDPETKNQIAELTGHADAVRAVAFSPDGTLLAAAGGLPARSGEVKIWNVAQRKLVATIKGHADCIYGVAFSPDGKTIATGSYDKLVKLWDASTGKEIRTFKDHVDAVYAVAFTPDGTRLLSGSADRTVKVWDVTTGKRLYTLSDAQDGVNALALDPTGTKVVAGGADKTLRIWELQEGSGKLLNTLIAHEDAILRVAWSPDAKYILSSSADKTVKLFNADDVSELKSLPQSGWSYGLRWSSDGQSFVIGRFDGTWDILQP